MPFSRRGAWWQAEAKLVTVWWWEVAARDQRAREGEKWDLRASTARGTAHLATRLETHSGYHYSTLLLCSANVCCILEWSVRSIRFQEKGLYIVNIFHSIHCALHSMKVDDFNTVLQIWVPKKEKEELHCFPLLFTFQCNGKKMRSLTLVPAGLVKIYCTSLNSWVNTLQPYGSFTTQCKRLWVHVCFVYMHVGMSI